MLDLDEKPNPQFQSQKAETLSTPQLPAPTWSHCRNGPALPLRGVSEVWCAWRTVTASSILQERAQGGEVELLRCRSALHQEFSISGPSVASIQIHFQNVKVLNNYKIQACCFCRRLISPKTFSVSYQGEFWGISPLLPSQNLLERSQISQVKPPDHSTEPKLLKKTSVKRVKAAPFSKEQQKDAVNSLQLL